MFDCVWPTRTAVSGESSPYVIDPVANLCQRFGNAVTPSGVLNLRHASFANDFGPIEEGCQCTSCRPKSRGGLGVTRAYIHHLASKETVGAHL